MTSAKATSGGPVDDGGAVRSTDVLVVGAGPVGLTLACGLLLHGISVRVVDAAPGPATSSRANVLHARGVEVLDRLGALGDLPKRVGDGLFITTIAGGRELSTVRFGGRTGSARPPMLVSQATVEAELRRRLSELGGSVEWVTGLDKATQDPQGVTAWLAGGQTVRAGWLAGCDGAHSMVRKQMGVAFPGAAITDQFLMADVHLDWPAEPGGTTVWLHADGFLAGLPMRVVGAAEDLWRVMAYVAGATDLDLTEHEILERLGQMIPERTGLPGAKIREAVWASVFRVHRRLVERYRRGRMLLAGDAAHIHSPFGGQGMLTGIGDAENLAWKLALVVDGRADAALLDTYEAERRPLATEVLRETSTRTQLLVSERLGWRLLRERLVAPISRVEAVQRRATAQASQLWVHYRRGPLGRRWSWVGSRPRPGDRVADLACQRPDGTATRLHAELGGRWAVLVPAGQRPPTDVGRWLGARVTTLTDRGSDKMLLVRPDAHLAWRGRPDSSGMARWLESALQHGRTR